MKYYKRPEPRGKFPAFRANYYQVGPGEQTCINFLNDCPIIIHAKEVPGQFPPLNRDVVEVGIPISEEEFNQAHQFALRETETTMIHPINSGIIMRACWQFYDGKERGTSLDVLRFLWPKYQRCLDQLITEGLKYDQAIPRNIHIMICRELRQQGYWKTV